MFSEFRRKTILEYTFSQQFLKGLIFSQTNWFRGFCFLCYKNIFEFFYHILFYICLKSEQNNNFENFVKNIENPCFLDCIYT